MPGLVSVPGGEIKNEQEHIVRSDARLFPVEENGTKGLPWYEQYFADFVIDLQNPMYTYHGDRRWLI